MSNYATTTEIQSYFKAQWAIARTEPINYEGIVDEGQDFQEGSNPWVRLTHNESTARQISLQNAPIYRANGTITVQCFQRAKTGTGVAEQMSDAVVTMFRKLSINGALSGLIRNDPGTQPTAQRIGVDPKGWFRINVTVPYIRDVQGIA